MSATTSLNALLADAGRLTDTLETIIGEGEIAEETADYLRRAAVAIHGARLDVRAGLDSIEEARAP